MDTETLYLFAEVMRHRSFTGIAKTLGIAPSSVSRSISALESEIGTRLFQRTTRQIVPTEAGLLYFERITPILEDLELARQLATEINEQPQGTLRITTPIGFGEIYIVPLLAEFSQLYPELSLDVLLNDRYTDLVEERIDIAIRVGSLQDSSYIARQLAPMSFYITASPDYLDKQGSPDSPEQVSEHNCLLFPRHGYNLNWLFKKNRKTQEVSVQGKHLITQSAAIKQCTLAGMGLSLLPDWLIKSEIEKGLLVKLFNEYQVTATDYNSSVWMLYPSREYVPVKVKLFSEFILKSFS
ncbi:Transcriptional regulator, LysR family [hydrothermal vent metagenome]|uniref:Transcriptional regulator, LysR family n=1 Tax=hydrothermal vent metagenome TaxID=652676 RepID=A0A3B0XQ21_9ZZZZ